MFSKILVPLDGTRESEAIIPFVARIAAGLGIRVVLLTVVHMKEFAGRSGLYDMIEREALERLERIRRQLRDGGVTADVVTAPGEPGEQILGVATDTGCDMIAMATRGNAPSDRTVLGSVTDEVVHLARLPVLVVSPDRAGMYAGQGKVSKALGRLFDPELTTILVPLDGSDLAEKVLPYAENISRRLGLRVILARVVWRLPDSAIERDDQVAQQQAQNEQEGRLYLESIAERLAASGLDVRTQLLTGRAANGIIDMASTILPDLSAIATRHAREWHLGSVAEEILRRTGDPVLVLSPD